MPTEAEKCACAQVISNSLLVVYSQVYTDCINVCGKSSKGGSSKATKRSTGE
jgi:hypothetical protein